METTLPRCIKLVVLGSTSGTDLQALIDCIEKKELQAEIQLVISNRKGAYIMTRAKEHGIPNYHIDYTRHSTREEAEAEMLQQIESHGGADLVLLIGWMKILTKRFLSKFQRRIWNVHPSLLPKHAGGMDLEVHKKVLEEGDTESGCTLHEVTEQVDGGAVIMQKKVPVEQGETPETLKIKVQAAEQRCLVEALIKLNTGEMELPAH